MNRKFIALFPLMMLAMTIVAIAGVVLGIVALIPLMIRPGMIGPFASYVGERFAKEMTHIIFSRGAKKTGGSSPSPFGIGV